MTRCLLLALQAKGQEEGAPTFDQGWAVFQPLAGGGVVSKIDGEGAVCSRRCGGWAHRAPPGHQVSSADETPWGSRVESSSPWEGLRALPLKSMECGICRGD